MLLGLFCALGACFVWGLIFVIPHFLEDYSPLEVALGRYFSYGVLSLALLFRNGVGVFRKISLKAWGMAIFFGLISNFLYYTGVVVGLRYATAPITVLILGMCPILVALYGNLRERECSFRSLVIPCIWMAFGMILVNFSEIDWTFSEYSARGYLIGLVSVLGSLFCWSWYAVHNANFLKKNIDIPRGEWATLLGVATFVWVIVSLFIFGRWGEGMLDLSKFFTINEDSLRYFGAIAILGIVCSWLGCFLWNHASSQLPVSLMGAFIIFETIFGLIFVYLVDFRFPSWLEFLGILSMLGGIAVSIYLFRRQQKPPSNHKIESYF